MSTVHESPWWPEFLLRLRTEPLPALAAEYGVTADDLEAALSASSGDRPVHEEGWWPEAVRRIVAGASLRDTARRFGAKPRRLRRGLARDGIRVAGENLDEDGVPALKPFAERLGKEPDDVLAEEAGVTPEAVQGERRRLGIAPYQPPPPKPPERTRDRPAPMGTERPPRQRAAPLPRHRREVIEPQVIRRPSSARYSSYDGRTGDQTEVVRRPRLLDAHEPPEGLVELDQPPARERQGRRRIVRPDAIRAREEEPEVVRVVRRRRDALHGEVREVAAEKVDLSELVLPAREAAADSPPRLADALPSPVEGEPETTAALPPLADLPSRRRERAPAVREVPAVAPPVDPPDAPVRAAGPQLGWQVSIDGVVQPWLIVAPHMAEAIALLALRVPPADLPRASIWAFGPVLEDEGA